MGPQHRYDVEKMLKEAKEESKARAKAKDKLKEDIKFQLEERELGGIDVWELIKRIEILVK